MGRKRKRLSRRKALSPKEQRKALLFWREKNRLKEKLAVSDKNREYEDFLKQFESGYPSRSDSDRQRQPQNRYSADRPVSQRTAHTSRQPVNNRTYTRQHIPQKRRTAKKRKQRRLFGISAAVLVIILLAILISVVAKSCSSGGDAPNGTDVLSGTWDLDGITVYQFDGKGNGALKLPDNTYSFTYKMKDNNLSIDFESESARDITYTFTVENEKLLLVSTEKDKEITYELTKTNDG